MAHCRLPGGHARARVERLTSVPQLAVHAFCRQGIYNGCMSKSITIRNVPDRASNELAARAARRGQSLQEFLRAELMALADRPDNRSLMEAIRTRKRAMGTTLASERVLELRDSDRR